MKNVQYWHSKNIYFWLLTLVETTLFLPIKLNSWAIAVLGLFYLVHSFVTPGKLSFRNDFWLFLVFFLIFLLGMTYTANAQDGLKELERRSSLVIIPLIIFTCKISLTRKDVERLILHFFNAGLIISLVLLMVAFVRYFKESNADVFFYEEFTKIIRLHPVYYSYFCLFGLLARFLILGKENYKNIFFWVINLFTTVILVVLASKMVIALLLIITVFLLFTYFKFLSIPNKVSIFVFFVIFILSSVLLFSEVKERATDILHVTESDLNQETYSYNYPFNGLTLRLVIWNLSVQHLYADGFLFFGVGTGDTSDYLNKVYAQHGLLDAGYLDYNAHNEYIEMLLTLGVIGVMYLVYIYFSGLIKSIFQKNYILSVFLLIFVFASWSESLLSVNKGIVFFSFFYPILLSMDKKNYA